MTTTQFLRRGAALALIALAASCGSDTITSPIFGAACNVGSISAGQTRYGVLDENSCVNSYDFWSEDRVPYAAWTVHLTKGKAYMFYEAQIPDSNNGDRNDIDAVLTLWGKNSSGAVVPLSISDDDGDGIDGHDSQIWFIAPESGTYELTTASYWDAGYGGYRLEAHECPVLTTMDTVGTYSLTLPASTCKRIGPNDVDTDTSAVSMIAIPVNPGDSIKTVITSSAFTPTWEIFGPGFDTYSNIYGPITRDDANYLSGNSTNLTMGELGGTVTLMVGSTTVDSAGAFTVAFSGVFAAAPPVGAKSWSIDAVSALPRNTPAPKKQH